MSDESWNMVKNAMEEIVMIINEAAGSVDADSKSIELAKKIFEGTMGREKQAVDFALKTIKDEIRGVF
jgi:ferritin-like protein